MAENKSKFQKLTPTRNADIGIYSEALDFVFKDKDLRNVAISGAYSAGKSSVIESYKANLPDKKFIHISLAHFKEADDSETSKTPKEADENGSVKESVLEGKILNQIIHQIDSGRIPQTNFRIKRKTNTRAIIMRTLLAVVFLLMFCHVLFFDGWQSYVANISPSWLKSALDFSVHDMSVLISGIIGIGLLSFSLYHIIKAQMGKGLFKRVSADKFEIEIFEGSDESFFDKYLNEVLYLFENCEADVIIFEDMDRYNANRIFERLREINTLINSQRTKQSGTEPLRFFYLLRDDIFVSKDRIKFFDFIIPIVPIVDGSNSYDQFIKHLTESGVFELFYEPFLQGLSLYVDDMRILKNICNEFIIYNSRLNITELSPNKLMAMIAYKNLFPRDFGDLQLQKGFVFALFDKKEQFITTKISQLTAKLEIAKERLDYVKKEHLTSISELDLITNNKRKSIKDALRNHYYNNNEQKEKQKELDEVNNEYNKRKQALEDHENEDSIVLAKNIYNIEQDIAKVKNEPLCEIITRDNISEIFATTSENDVGDKLDYKDIRGNDYFALLKYLISLGQFPAALRRI